MSQSKIDEDLTDTAQVGDYVSATITRDGQIVGFDESQRSGRAARGDTDPSRRIVIRLTGIPPRGEEGTLNTSRRLVDRLNVELGEHWDAPVEVNGVKYIDAKVCGVGPFAGREKLIQVVRALTSPKFWQSLGYDGQVSASLSVIEAAKVLKDAVDFKASKIPKSSRAILTLALDATDVPSLAFTAVIDEFNRRYGAWVETQGFHEVWIVGPRNEMVHRLGLAET